MVKKYYSFTVNYLGSVDSDWFKQRITVAIFGLLAAFVVLFLRLFYLQIVEGAEYRRLSESNCIRLRSLDAPRGLIFDRNGQLLVDNRPSFDLGIVLKDSPSPSETLHKLANYLNLPSDEFIAKIRQNRSVPAYSPIVLKQDIGRRALAVVEARKFDLPGVVIQVNPRRQYLFNQSSAHLLGYLGEINAAELKRNPYHDAKAGDYIGKFGIERAYEGHFRGKRGGQQVEVDASGQTVRVLKTVAAEPGHNLKLTIDQRLQAKAEALLEGVAGAVVAMEPNSGEVLALVSSPTFDQNAFVSGMSSEVWQKLISDPFRPMENKAVQGAYPPASTYKIITAIAGLEEGVIDPSTTFECFGFHRFGNRIFRCWKRGGHGTVNINVAIAQSCDVYFYQVGQRLGIDRLAWYAKACGLGSPTGIELEPEAKGLVPTAQWKKQRTGVPWQGGETLSVAIGQGYNLVTPLQMAVLASAVANGGTRYRPSLIKAIEAADGQTLHQEKPVITGRLPASSTNLALVRRGLWEVVNVRKGTARIARLDQIDISGKTGTAQVVGRRKSELWREAEKAGHLKAHAWFVAYAPSDDPRIALAVFVENAEHGSSGASPVARELIKTYLSDDGHDHQLTAQLAADF